MSIVGPSPYSVTKSSPLVFHSHVALEDVLESFEAISRSSADRLSAIEVSIPQHILRTDVFDVFSRALGRQLFGIEVAAINKCFVCDTSAVMVWDEFKKSFQALQMLSSDPKPCKSGNSHSKIAASVRLHKANPYSPQQALNRPITSSQDYGWSIGAAPAQCRSEQYYPAKKTDVTRGEGRSAHTYFGLYL